jgi:hypothetical protein
MMDIQVVSALAGVLGSLVGGSVTVATAWITQTTMSKRELIRTEIRKREALYGEFIGECSRLLMDSLAHTIDKPETLFPAYALLNRIRLTASKAVLAEAEQMLSRIAEQYFSPNLSMEEMRALAQSAGADPLRLFGEACRIELKSMRTASRHGDPWNANDEGRQKRERR